MNRSAIARLREQIDLEIAGMQRAMHGYAVVARHEIISSHYDNLDLCFEKLKCEIGEVAAISALIEALETQL